MARSRQYNVGNYGTSPYYVCSHTGCQRKVRDHVTDHDCCGGVRHDLEHAYTERTRAERAAGIVHTEPSARVEAVWFAIFAGVIFGGVKLLAAALGDGRR